MKFQVVIIEPEGYRFAHFLYDYAKLFCYSLESLGHECIIVRNSFDVARINLIVGGHLLRKSADVVKLVQDKIRYVVLQTEIFQIFEENHFQQLFLPMLRGAQAVWEALPVNKPYLDALGIQAKYHQGGFHPAAQEVVHKRNKDIDFLFFGSVTPRRQQLLAGLRQRGYQLFVDFDSPAIYRNDLIARSHVTLAPRQTDVTSHFSWPRVCFLLNNRSLVVVEDCVHQEWLQDCFPHTDTAHWLELCVSTLERPDREELLESCWQHFQRLPMTEVIRPLVETLPP